MIIIFNNSVIGLGNQEIENQIRQQYFIADESDNILTTEDNDIILLETLE